MTVHSPRELSLAVHELRTPVTVVSGYVRMLLCEQAGGVTAPQRTMLEEAAWSGVTIGDDAVTPSLVEGASATTPPAFDEWRGGLGLALPIGRCVIEAHGG